LYTALNRSIAEGSVLASPKPYVWIAGIKDGMVTYNLAYYVNVQTMIPPLVQTEVLGRAIDFLKASGIRLQPSHLNEYRRMRSPAEDRHTEIEARLRVLTEVPLLSLLSKSELESLTEHSTLLFMNQGDEVMRVNEQGESMFVVAEGCLDVRVETPDGPKVVATLWPSECAGEMSLLTGSPRSATVVAREASWVIEVNKEAFTPILRDNPALVEQIALTIEKRKANALKQSKSESDSQKSAETSSMVSKIRSFFKL
jgi:CRP-like cAMP-binding protein